MSDVSLIIATYEEEESLEFVLNELSNFIFNEIIIVDNNSKDNTLKIAKKYKTKILQQKGSGWGSAVIEGLNAASGKYLTYMDGDGSYNPEGIVEMYNLINDFDFICCSRYKNNNKNEDDTFIRALGNKLFTLIANQFLNLKISDALFFYPLFKKSDFEDLKPKSKNFGVCIEIPYLMSKKGLSYTDVLSLERKRYGGTTKVNAFKDGFTIGLEIIKMKFRN